MVQLTTAVLLLVAAVGTGAVPAVNNPTELNDLLTAHNDERAKHGANPLIWDENLVSSAQAWANQCKFKYSQPGQSLYVATGVLAPGDPFDAWNSESEFYDPKNPIPSRWTQIVWKETTKLGCAFKLCPPGTIFAGESYYYVCHYDPVGNLMGLFPANVQK